MEGTRAERTKKSRRRERRLMGVLAFTALAFVALATAFGRTVEMDHSAGSLILVSSGYCHPMAAEWSRCYALGAEPTFVQLRVTGVSVKRIRIRHHETYAGFD